MTLLTPVFDHLVEICIRNGRVQSPRSWERYGRDLYDFFSYVTANNYDWRANSRTGMPNLLEIYRDWSISECGLKRVTVNQRLRTIQRFYLWARRHDLIKELPWTNQDVRFLRTPSFLAHSASQQGSIKSTSLMLRQTQVPVKFLTLDDCATCIKAIDNVTHRLMFRLALQTGLRSEELQTFPEKYVVNPADQIVLRGKHRVRLWLDPVDMSLKGSRGRAIDVPIDLMLDLWQYSVLERPKLAKRVSGSSPSLFLTVNGGRFNKSSIQNLFNSVSLKAGIKVTCHMLRHTYATYTLHGLQQAGFSGERLLYVRDRLGHSSVHTTETYLHLLDQLDPDLILRHEEEINRLFMRLV